LDAFLRHCSKKIGDDYFRTPRNTIRAFLDLLAILDQNPGADWNSLLAAIEVAPDRPVSQPDIGDDLSGYVMVKPEDSNTADDGLATYH
jgi:P-loop Domain of unknown function (DUF2791)